MRWLSRAVATLVLAVALPAAAAGAVWSAPPSNDTFAGAKVISTLPFSQTLDTSETTTDANDAEVLSVCGVPPGAAANARRTVWYAYTPSTDQVVTVDASNNPYRVAAAVVTGAPGSFSRTNCSLFQSSFLATAGQTYYTDLSDFDGNGNGTLNLSVTAIPAPATALTVNANGRFDPRTGVATVSGTVSCSTGASGYVTVDLAEPAAHPKVTGTGYTFDVTCDGGDHPWSISVTANSGRFVGGPVNVSATSSACAIVTCASDQENRNVLLRP